MYRDWIDSSRGTPFEGCVMSPLTPQQMMLVFQFGAVGLFVLFVIAAAIQQNRRSAAQQEIYRALADETGGSFTMEKRTIENLVWIGGPTVRWTVRGVPVTLTSYRKDRNSSGVRFQAPIRLSRSFQFHVITQSVLARFAMSPQIWNAVIASAEKEAEKKAARGGVSEQAARDAIQKLRFMASEPVRTGDALFDEAFLLKTDDPDRARDLLTSSGVSYWMQEMRKTEKAFTFALTVSDQNDGYSINLELMGAVTNPASLRAARSILEGAIGRLVDQGAAAATGSGRPAA